MTTAHTIPHAGSSDPDTAASPALPSAILPAPRIIPTTAPNPSPAENFISTIILSLGTLKTSVSNRWAPIISGDNEAGISLRNILWIAYELSCSQRDTENFFKKGRDRKQNHSKIIFNLVNSLINNPEINKEQLHILETSVTSLNTIGFQQGPREARSASRYLSSEDYQPLIQQIQQRKIPQPPTPNPTSNSPFSSQPDQVSQLQETDIYQDGLKRKADSESIPPSKRKRDTLEEIADSGNMPPLQVSTEPVAMSASKNIMFKAPTLEDTGIRATEQKQEKEIMTAEIILTIQRDYHSLQWRW
jgi:hypothetical protein